MGSRADTGEEGRAAGGGEHAGRCCCRRVHERHSCSCSPYVSRIFSGFMILWRRPTSKQFWREGGDGGRQMRGMNAAPRGGRLRAARRPAFNCVQSSACTNRSIGQPASRCTHLEEGGQRREIAVRHQLLAHAVVLRGRDGRVHKSGRQ